MSKLEENKYYKISTIHNSSYFAFIYTMNYCYKNEIEVLILHHYDERYTLKIVPWTCELDEHIHIEEIIVSQNEIRRK